MHLGLTIPRIREIFNGIPAEAFQTAQVLILTSRREGGHGALSAMVGTKKDVVARLGDGVVALDLGVFLGQLKAAAENIAKEPRPVSRRKSQDGEYGDSI
jgi:hypothetical protein